MTEYYHRNEWKHLNQHLFRCTFWIGWWNQNAASEKGQVTGVPSAAGELPRRAVSAQLRSWGMVEWMDGPQCLTSCPLQQQLLGDVSIYGVFKCVCIARGKWVVWCISYLKFLWLIFIFYFHSSCYFFLKEAPPQFETLKRLTPRWLEGGVCRHEKGRGA